MPGCRELSKSETIHNIGLQIRAVEMSRNCVFTHRKPRTGKHYQVDLYQLKWQLEARKTRSMSSIFHLAMFRLVLQLNEYCIIAFREFDQRCQSEICA